MIICSCAPGYSDARCETPSEVSMGSATTASAPPNTATIIIGLFVAVSTSSGSVTLGGCHTAGSLLCDLGTVDTQVMVAERAEPFL